MCEWQDSVNALVDIIADYRLGEIPRPDVEHVERWISQFEEHAQLDILKGTVFTLGKTYYSKDRVQEIFSHLLHHELAGNDPATFWSDACLLNIQQGGSSQQELVELFQNQLEDEFHERAWLNYHDATVYFYLDDSVFSGQRLLADMTRWINNDAPQKALVYIAVIGMHAYAEWNIGNKLNEVIRASGKAITYGWVWDTFFEDRLKYTDTSDVLRPLSAPANEDVEEYIEAMVYKPHFRSGSSRGDLTIFSSAESRHLLEQQFLIAGAYIRTICPLLPPRHRPLGYNSLEMLGFGSMFVTYRNCPNNAPLALWVGNPWYPLLPRSNN
jgi:hypothetical protein